MTSLHNLLDQVPAELPEELFETLTDHNGCRIERIVSSGHASPPGFWYDQTEHEFVVLLQGTAAIGFRDRPDVQLRPGSWLEIPARQQHRVLQTSQEPKAIWLAVFWTVE